VSLGASRKPSRELAALVAILVAYVLVNVAIVAARPLLMRRAIASVDSTLMRDRGQLDRELHEWRSEMHRDGRWVAAVVEGALDAGRDTRRGARPALPPDVVARLGALVAAQVPSARVWVVASDGSLDGPPVASLAPDAPTRRHRLLAQLAVRRDSALLAASEVRGRDLRVAIAVPLHVPNGGPLAAILDVSVASRLRPRLPAVAWEGHDGRAALTFPFDSSYVGATWTADAPEPEIHWPADGWTLADSSLIVVGGALADTTPRYEVAIPRAAAAALVQTRTAWLHALAALAALPLSVGVLLVGRARREARLRDAETALADARLRTAQAETAAARAELSVVHARLNPHFLSNALHSVSALVDSDPGAAEDALDRLGDLFRYSLEQSERHTVRLGDEWRFVRDYLAIEQMRLGDRLTVLMELDPDAAQVEVPSLLLQPLVENAVRHGIVPRREGGTVRVSARLCDDRVDLQVSDDGVGTDSAALPGARGTGLRTLRQRLELDRSLDGHIAIDTAPGRGFRVRVSLAIEPRGVPLGG